MSDEPHILTSVDEHGVMLVTINRPEVMNALSVEMMALLEDAIGEASTRDDVYAMVLTGAGRGFCAGLDLKARADDEDGGGAPDLRLFDLHNTPPLVLHRMDKPVICALNGPAAGYGMDMALGCDIRIASDRAKLGAVFVRRGVLPESGGTWYLPRLVGWAKAAEIAFMGDVLDAERSLEMGLVNRVVPHDDLMDEVAAMAARIASNAPYSVQATKRMMRLGMDETFETAVDHTYLQLRPMFGSEDFREGMTAFLERRDPSFKGR